MKFLDKAGHNVGLNPALCPSYSQILARLAGKIDEYLELDLPCNAILRVGRGCNNAISSIIMLFTVAILGADLSESTGNINIILKGTSM